MPHVRVVPFRWVPRVPARSVELRGPPTDRVTVHARPARAATRGAPDGSRAHDKGDTMTIGAATIRAAALLAVAACGSATTGRGSQFAARLAASGDEQFRRYHVAPERSTLRVLGSDVLAADGSRPLVDLVNRQWPTLLSPLRPSAGTADVRGDAIGVYSGQNFLGGQAVLGTVPARQVLAVYRLTRNEEYARYGRVHDGGALEIVWRSPGAVRR